MMSPRNTTLKNKDNSIKCGANPQSCHYGLPTGLDVDIYRFIDENVSLNQRNVIIRSAELPFLNVSKTSLDVMIDFCPMSFDEGQKSLYQINHLLRDGGVYISCVDLLSFRRKNKIFHSRAAKSKAEVLGRLFNAGFSIIEYRDIQEKLYICCLKTDLPKGEPKANKGIIIPMERIGMHGDKVKIFKFRTMHPFSEYLQDYVVGLNGYNEKGKPRNDFRLTKLGQFMRKYWIDELPQVYNIIKGELAIVGVRPLSVSRFMELPEDVRQERIKYKPGCIPPYVALLMSDSKSNIEAERIYLKQKKEHLYWTDIKYLFLALFNILTGKIRSA